MDRILATDSAGASCAGAPPQRAGRASGRLRTAVATVGGNLFLVLGTPLFATAAILAALVPPLGSRVHGVARTWAKFLLAASLLRL